MSNEIRNFNLLENILHHVTDWEYCEFKHRNLRQELSFALNQLESSGKIKSDICTIAAAGLIWHLATGQVGTGSGSMDSYIESIVIVLQRSLVAAQVFDAQADQVVQDFQERLQDLLRA